MTPDILNPDILKFVHRIQIQTAHLSHGILSGAYRSAFRGTGLEFFDTREYLPGDEVRHIDWNQSSRTNRLYVKTYREERHLDIILAIDISASERFGTRQQLKSQLMAEIGGILAFATLRNNDKVGLILYTDTVEKYIPPRQSFRNALRIIREMLLHQPQGKGTDTANALRFLGKVLTKPGVCFLMSDFLCPDFSKEAALLARRHDLIGVAITDRGETNMPLMPLAAIQDLETGQDAIVSIPNQSIQKKLYDYGQERLLESKKLLLSSGADFIQFETDKPYLPLLQNFLKRRSKKVL